QYAAQAPLCFLPPLLCQRVFTRFLQGMERLDSLNSGSVFLGSYIHKALVILFNSLLVEEYLACHDNAEGLKLTTPLSSDNIFIQNFRKVADAEALATDSGPVNLPSGRYPLTRLVMACPLWRFYVKPDAAQQDREQNAKIVFCMLENFWPGQHIVDDPVVYLDGYKFENLYYIYNTFAVRRSLWLPYDLRTERGKAMNMPKRPKKIVTKTLLDATQGAIETGILTKEMLKKMDDGTDDFAKKVFNLFYHPYPSMERLWANATAATKKAILKGLREIINEDKAGNTK
ncbi:MAG: hypothetical protein MSH25_04140, partial [Desulfovibrio sp.]|uniref:hypothetical protein n=1 Tax=Desulfovibrio sp. TaxID=885 RepID=UPI0025BC57B7